jgi:hypothetical protein
MKAVYALMGLLALASPILLSPPSAAQTFTVDFGRWSGPPLVKTKFGVYQTPFLPPSTWPKMMPLLQEAGVRDFRYEMAWGKPDARAFDQITGTAEKPVINFAPIDALANGLKAVGVHPLFAMTYDPLPLKIGDAWQRWKDVPSDLDAWGRINRSYAAHYRTALGLHAPFYEVWNEPDLPGDGGKVFFNGGPADYARVYAAAQAGLRAGDPDGLIGGPGIAYDTSYVAAALAHPMDFVSIHAYANYANQIRSVRPLLAPRPDLPIFLTEYASFKNFGPTAPISRAEGAARFFMDVRGLLDFPDVPKVYWAQWADDSIGLLTNALHRKALYNAFKVYQTQMPVDRNPVSPESEGEVAAMASSDDHAAAVVLWNAGAEPGAVAVHLNRLPFRAGTLAVSRIDKDHASFVDAPSAENLSVEARQAVTSHAAVWAGTVPAHGVVLLWATDASQESLLRPASIGTYIRTRWWFFDRQADSYADYDPHTCIARLGMGTRDFSLAQTGVVLDHPAPRLAVQVTRQGAFIRKDADTLLGVRVDYETGQGWTRSALWHDGSYSSRRDSALPWGKGGAAVDKSYAVSVLEKGQGLFVMDVARNAPHGWNGRIVLTPILQNAGAGVQARLIFRSAPAAAGTRGARRRTPA